MGLAGQAQDAPTFDDIAALLVENPEADAPEDEADDAEAPEQSDNAEDDQNPEDDEADDDSGQSPDDEAEAKAKAAAQTSDAKLKFTIKGEDGAEKQIEATPKEIAESWMRREDYTRKTQELGERERQAHEVVSRKLSEGQSYYMQEAAKVHAALNAVAGLKTDQEMAALAVENPALWVQENQRATAIRGVLQTIEQNIQAERQKTSGATSEQQQAEFQRAWGVLGQQGIDKPKLKTIFDGVKDAYGVPEEKFAQISDPKLVLIMRDAMEYRALKTKAEQMKKDKPNKGKPLPSTRQNVPQADASRKRLDTRFRSGKANVRDLASFIQMQGK
jgi:hypothetical protein